MALTTKPSVRRRVKALLSDRRVRHLAPREDQGEVEPFADGERVDDERGVLRADTGKLALPDAFDDSDERPWWRPGGVMIVILVCSILFLMFVAYLTHRESEWTEQDGWKVKVPKPK